MKIFEKTRATYCRNLCVSCDFDTTVHGKVFEQSECTVVNRSIEHQYYLCRHNNIWCGRVMAITSHCTANQNPKCKVTIRYEIGTAIDPTESSNWCYQTPARFDGALVLALVCSTERDGGQSGALCRCSTCKQHSCRPPRESQKRDRGPE